MQALAAQGNHQSVKEHGDNTPASSMFPQTHHNKCLQNTWNQGWFHNFQCLKNLKCCWAAVSWETQKQYPLPKMKWKHQQEACCWCLRLSITPHVTTSLWTSLPTLQSARPPPALTPPAGQATCTQTQRNLLSISDSGWSSPSNSY